MFLTILLFIILGFWLLGFLLRWLMPLLLIRMQKKFTNQFNNQYGGQFNNASQSSQGGKKSTRKEGDITVEATSAPQEHKIDKNLGDYVEFEEEK